MDISTRSKNYENADICVFENVSEKLQVPRELQYYYRAFGVLHFSNLGYRSTDRPHQTPYWIFSKIFIRIL